MPFFIRALACGFAFTAATLVFAEDGVVSDQHAENFDLGEMDSNEPAPPRQDSGWGWARRRRDRRRGIGHERREALHFRGNLFPCTKESPCGECQGHCEDDDGCKAPFSCFNRLEHNMGDIPGCRGGESGDVMEVGYCWRKHVDSPTDDAITNHGLMATENGFVPHTAQVNTPMPTQFSYPLRSLGKGKKGCTMVRQCPECMGNCNYDMDCKGTLKCFRRDGRTDVPGCHSSPSERSGDNYCYDAEDAFRKAARDDDGHPYLVDRGNDGCSKESTCHPCQGDCDSDEDCMDGLKCFKRELMSKKKVPGCAEGGVGDSAGMDYCYMPSHD